MESFEFLMVLVSIILGLGIAEILSVVARIFRRELEPGWLHSAWMAIVLLLSLQAFWAAWGYQGRPDWSYAELVLFLVPRLLVYVVASVLNPPATNTLPLDDYFMDIRRRFFAAFAGFLITASLVYGVLSEGPGAPDIVRGVYLLLFAGLAASERRDVHLAGALVVLAIFLAFTFSFSFSLSQMLGAS